MNFWKLHLDWGWNPVIFVIVLVISFVLIAVVKKRVLWLVPALVVYAGLSWGLPFAWIFKTIFWVSLVAVLLMAFWSRRPTRFAKFPLVWMSALVAVVLVLSGINGWVDVFNGNGQRPAPPSALQTPPSPSATLSAAACKSTWPMANQTPSNGNWVAKGVSSIKKAKTKAEARAAATDWLNQIKGVPGTLQGAVTYLLNKQVSLSSLRNANGCATAEAKSLVNELSVALAMSDISPSQAPVNGYNSGTKSGSTYMYSSAGVSGDRGAIEIKLRRHQVVWIMSRCGNPVTKHPPTPSKPSKPGRPGHPPPPQCPPSTPYGHWPICKDGPQNDPGAKGNAPIGSGKNKNPGPGVYQPSPAPKGPSHHYTPPAPPQPSKTPRPTPAPSPAPGAPAVSDAPTSCAPPPGMTHC